MYHKLNNVYIGSILALLGIHMPFYSAKSAKKEKKTEGADLTCPTFMGKPLSLEGFRFE